MEWAMKAMDRITAGTFWINDPLTDNDAGPLAECVKPAIRVSSAKKDWTSFRETNTSTWITNRKSNRIGIRIRSTTAFR